MAREFTTSDELSDSFNEISTFPFTFCCWAKTNNTTGIQVLIQLGNGTTLADSWALLFRGDIAGDPVQLRADGDAGATTADSSTGYSSGTWHHVLGVVNSASSRTIYLDGGSNVNDTTANNISLPTNVNLGSDFTGSNSLNTGSIAEVAFWDVALTASEITSLASGVSPKLIRPGNLTRGSHLWQPSGSDVDYVTGGTLTQTGTVAFSDHPVIFHPIPPMAAAPTPTATARNITVSVSEGGDTTTAVVDVVVTLTAALTEAGDSATATLDNVINILASLNEEGDANTANLAVVTQILASLNEQGDTTTAFLNDGTAVTVSLKKRKLYQQLQ